MWGLFKQGSGPAARYSALSSLSSLRCLLIGGNDEVAALPPLCCDLRELQGPSPAPFCSKPGDIWWRGEKLGIGDSPAETIGKTTAEVLTLEVACGDALVPEDLAVLAHHQHARHR